MSDYAQALAVELQVSSSEPSLSPLITRSDLRSLSKLRPWRSLAQIGFEYLSIAAAIILCETYWHPSLFFAVLLWIAGRQHGIGVLGHDAVHSTLFRKRWQNEVAGEILHATLLMDFRSTRAHHLSHHRHLGSELDPDFEIDGFPIRMENVKRSKLVWCIVKPLTGILAPLLGLLILRQIADTFRTKPSKYSLFRLAISLTIVASCVVSPDFLRIFFCYWILPAATWTLFTVQLRGFAEHHGLNSDDPLAQSRTVHTSFTGKYLISPNNINYHNAHHLYSSVPWYNLPELDRKLLENARYREKAAYSQGYGHFAKDFIMKWSA